MKMRVWFNKFVMWKSYADNLSMSIYEKYGGYDFFHSRIYDLYLEMFDHPEISYHFVGVDIYKLSKLQTQYLARAIGCTQPYEGGEIKVVHKDMEITPFQFNEIAKSFRGVFERKGVEKADVDFIMNFIAGHETDIVTVKTSWIDRLMRPIYKLWKKLFHSK